jgi:succinate-semialdehyde dehydrogenase/glutarate-semialdehyde dehydrogenase
MAPGVYQTINPATGELLKTYPEISNTEALSILSTAQTTYETDWRLRPISSRAQLISKAASILRSKVEEYAHYITLEMGKLIDQARGEVLLSAAILDYYAQHGEEFLATTTFPDAPGSIVVSEPIGVILAVEPWNFPYYQLARVAGPQLVAGNVVICKHASNVPQCAIAFARLFEEAGAPAGVYSNILGSVSQVNLLIDDFRVRGVTLTGCEKAGKSVAARAGLNLKKVVLELGGSDPFVVLEDADLELALDQAEKGRMENTGQGCICSKRFIIVGKERGGIFLDGLVKKMGSVAAGDPFDPKTQLGPLVSEGALKGLLGQIEGAKDAGARIVLGGKQISRPGFYLEPTIITDITEDNPLYQEETFGPIASVYVVESEEEAIQLANATQFGLGSAVFSTDIEHAQQVARRIESGMVFINSAGLTSPELPFGGIKNSGFGRELSELGVGEFLNKKLIRVA